MSKLADADTRVLVLMNGLLCEELFVEWFGGGRRVFGGMAFTCINRQGNEHLLLSHSLCEQVELESNL